MVCFSSWGYVSLLFRWGFLYHLFNLLFLFSLQVYFIFPILTEMFVRLNQFFGCSFIHKTNGFLIAYYLIFLSFLLGFLTYHAIHLGKSFLFFSLDFASGALGGVSCSFFLLSVFLGVREMGVGYAYAGLVVICLLQL